MIKDRFDLPVSAARADAVAAYDAYALAFLSYGPDVRALFPAADGSPDAPLLQAHAAALHMAFEAVEGFEKAEEYLVRMRAAAARATPREAAFCAAVEAWATHDFKGALAALEAMTAAWPADLCALKWGQYHAYNLGDDAALARLGERAMIAWRGAPYAHGMRAFGLEQSHRIGEAEDEARRALSIEPGDAWAHHALAHVYETYGRAEEGARFMRAQSRWWADRGVFIREHNWWHAAVFDVARGRPDAALDLYDARLVGEWPEFPQEQIGAISMLWRLELRGVDVGDRWLAQLEQARARAGETILAFHELHYVYAIARAGSGAETDAHLAAIERRAERDDPYADVWREAALPAARAVAAFAQGRREEAAEGLARALPRLQEIGGSHAQRHVFIQTFEAARASRERSAA